MSIASTTAVAATDSKSLAVATRALAFLEPKLSGPTPVAVVYESGDGASEADARLIVQGLAAAKSNGVSFQPRLVASNSAGSLASAKVVFVASGTGDHASIFATASKARAVTISFDMGCVNADRCVIGVRTGQKVEIVVSRAARLASGTRFSQAFLMLVTEK